MKKPKQFIVGYYSPYGYEINLLDSNGQIKETLHTTRNHKFDSYQGLPLGHKHSLSLKEIKNCCIQTSKEISKEKGIKFVGVELDKSLIEEIENLLREKEQ